MRHAFLIVCVHKPRSPHHVGVTRNLSRDRIVTRYNCHPAIIEGRAKVEDSILAAFPLLPTLLPPSPFDSVPLVLSSPMASLFKRRRGWRAASSQASPGHLVEEPAAQSGDGDGWLSSLVSGAGKLVSAVLGPDSASSSSSSFYSSEEGTESNSSELLHYLFFWFL